jgi:serine/threonine protein kinase
MKGTPIYMAPELHFEKEGNSKIDIFSLGVVIYRLAFEGKFPFFDQNRKYRSMSEYFKELIHKKLIIPENHKYSPDLI